MRGDYNTLDFQQLEELLLTVLLNAQYHSTFFSQKRVKLIINFSFNSVTP